MPPLYPQRIPQTQELLSAGYVRCGTVPGELFRPDGSALVLGAGNLPKGPAVPDVGAAPSQAQFNALLASLRTAGVIAP